LDLISRNLKNGGVDVFVSNVFSEHIFGIGQKKTCAFSFGWGSVWPLAGISWALR